MKDTISKYLNEGEKAAPVLGFDDYYITSTGRVFSSKTKFEYQTLYCMERIKTNNCKRI